MKNPCSQSKFIFSGMDLVPGSSPEVTTHYDPDMMATWIAVCGANRNSGFRANDPKLVDCQECKNKMI